jgi:excisionase family DNA binding protein
MTNATEHAQRYPLLTALLEQREFPLQGLYTVRDAAKIFGVSTRTIQEWCRDGKLLSRDLPGRNRFLSEDLEHFLQTSVKTREGSSDGSNSVSERRRRSLGEDRTLSRPREVARSLVRKKQSSLFKQSDHLSS